MKFQSLVGKEEEGSEGCTPKKVAAFERIVEHICADLKVASPGKTAFLMHH